MAYGGRGGAGGGGKQLPFEVDTALEDQVAAYRNNFDDDDWTKTLYPPMPRAKAGEKKGVVMAPPPTAREKKMVNKWREHQTALRNGPLFINATAGSKRDASEYNAFEETKTYGNKKAKRGDGLPDLKKVPIVKELLPRELWDIVSDGEEDDDETAPPVKKNLDFLKKKRLDKLARFDDNADADGAADVDADDADEREADDEDQVEIPEDDDFSEDDDDLGNDYNAEKYFDDGDGADDDGDDAGGDEAWEDTTEKIKPFKPQSGWQYIRYGDSRMEDPDGDYGYDGDRGK